MVGRHDLRGRGFALSRQFHPPSAEASRKYVCLHVTLEHAHCTHMSLKKAKLLFRQRHGSSSATF